MRAHIVLIDESGALLGPLVRRTLAPRGQTPVLSQQAKHRQKVSMMSALSLSPLRRQPNLYFQTYRNDHVTNEHAAVFVRNLLWHLRGNVMVIWDRGNMHKGEPIQRVLARHPRLSIELLPPYAPDLNPVEHLWNFVKYVRRANFAPHDVEQLEAALITDLEEARRDPQRLWSFLEASELSTEWKTLAA